MKIAFIGYRLEPKLSEAIKNKTFFLAQKLTNEKHKVIFITNGKSTRRINYKGIKINICGCGTNNYAFWKNRNGFIKFAAQILRKEQPDIIHDVFGMLGTSIITWRIIKKSKLKKTRTVRTIGAHGFATRDLIKVLKVGIGKGLIQEYLPSLIFDNSQIRQSIIRKFDNILCLSNHLSQEFKHKSKIEINNSIELNKFLDYKEKNKEKIRKFKRDNKIDNKDVILYLGHLKVQKGVKYIIKAMPAILKKNNGAVFMFALSGLGEDKMKYVKMLRTMKLFKDRIKIIDKIEPSLAFSVSKIFILPLLFQWGTQAQPDSLIEALACGCVPVVSDVGSISEVVKHRQNGLLVKAFSSQDIVKKISEILSDKKLYKKIQGNTMKDLKRFDWRENLSKYKKNYHNLLKVIK